MKRLSGILSALILLASGSGVQADLLVLVHGYLSDARDWDGSGVSSTLEVNGWPRAGVLIPGPAGTRLLQERAVDAPNRFYSVNLPADAPLSVQASGLEQALNLLATRHPQEPIILAGHSAGGVVARMVVVRNTVPAIVALVTIASPHLGTQRAEQALDLANLPAPLSWMASMVVGGPAYDTMRRSRGLYHDLVRPRPGTLLYWLNAQPHPDIRYVSIIRGEPSRVFGDAVVPGYSQDMNGVPALAGRSAVVTVATGHGLELRDGLALLGAIRTL